MSSDEIMIKLGTFGESAVGKTCLLNRYVNDSFNPDHDSTMTSEILEKIITIKKQTFYLKLWDTAGQERLYAITRQYYQGLQGLILVYDQTKRESFMKLNNWLEKINAELVLEKIGIVIVGNKSDLDNKEVPVEEGKKFAEKIGAPFIETSAANNINVEECFNTLVQEVINKCPDFNRDKKGYVSLKQNNNKKSEGGCCGGKS
jgi:small GTP-binding protein